MKLVIIIAISFCSVACSASSDEPKERQCQLAYKCSLEEDTTWTTDGDRCILFRNPCHLANENCNRQNRNVPELENVTKEKCQTLCNPRCPRIMKPVCGYYNKEKLQFNNQCLLDYQICSTGQTYMIYNEGRCKEPLILDTN